MAYKKDEVVLFNGVEVTIVDVIKGGKTTEPVLQGGILTGHKSRPSRYKLSTGQEVRGNKLQRLKK